MFSVHYLLPLEYNSWHSITVEKDTHFHSDSRCVSSILKTQVFLPSPKEIPVSIYQLRPWPRWVFPFFLWSRIVVSVEVVLCHFAGGWAVDAYAKASRYPHGSVCGQVCRFFSVKFQIQCLLFLGGNSIGIVPESWALTRGQHTFHHYAPPRLCPLWRFKCFFIKMLNMHKKHYQSVK